MTGFELEILRAIQSLKCGLMDALMPAVTFLGNGGLIWIIAAVILLCFKKTRKCGIAVAAALIMGALLNSALIKPIIARERPFTADSTIKLLISPPTDYSFASGHTLSSFAAATAMAFYSRKIGIPAYFVAASVAFSRLYLMVHFPTDVLGGAIIGVGIGFVGVAAAGYIHKKTEYFISSRRAKTAEEERNGTHTS